MFKIKEKQVGRIFQVLRERVKLYSFVLYTKEITITSKTFTMNTTCILSFYYCK